MSTNIPINPLKKPGRIILIVQNKNRAKMSNIPLPPGVKYIGTRRTIYADNTSTSTSHFTIKTVKKQTLWCHTVGRNAGLGKENPIAQPSNRFLKPMPRIISKKPVLPKKADDPSSNIQAKYNPNTTFENVVETTFTENVVEATVTENVVEAVVETVVETVPEAVVETVPETVVEKDVKLHSAESTFQAYFDRLLDKKMSENNHGKGLISEKVQIRADSSSSDVQARACTLEAEGTTDVSMAMAVIPSKKVLHNQFVMDALDKELPLSSKSLPQPVEGLLPLAFNLPNPSYPTLHSQTDIKAKREKCHLNQTWHRKIKHSKCFTPPQYEWYSCSDCGQIFKENRFKALFNNSFCNHSISGELSTENTVSKCLNCNQVFWSHLEQHAARCSPLISESDTSVDISGDIPETTTMEVEIITPPPSTFQKINLATLHQCGICQEFSNSLYDLKDHVNEVHPEISNRIILEPRLTCTACLEKCADTFELTKHAVQCSKEVAPKPSIMSLEMLKEDLKQGCICKRRHRLLEKTSMCFYKSGIFLCILCTYKTIRLDRYSEHVKKYHFPSRDIGDLFKCHFCSQKFTSETGALQHMAKTHLSEKMDFATCSPLFNFQSYEQTPLSLINT